MNAIVKSSSQDANSWDFLSSEYLMPGQFPRLDSPIERAFLRCFCYVLLGVPAASDLVIQPQMKVGQYRADFAIGLPDLDPVLIVECDGHQFHDGDKVAAARDKARDRWMALSGLTVFRFTGSEIYANPYECAAQSIACVMNRLGR